jgi:SH3-like domain-containing protein
MRCLFFILIFSFVILPFSAFSADEPSKTALPNSSGLPVPRFVALKSNEVNVRTGPGTRYPISWVYHRSGMPVEIVEEFDMWRKIRDTEGTTGWVHKTMLEGKRSVMIKGKSAQMVRNDHEKDAQAIMKVEPTVTAKLLECIKDWCKIKVSDSKGWIEKSAIWGVYPNEIIE